MVISGGSQNILFLEVVGGTIVFLITAAHIHEIFLKDEQDVKPQARMVCKGTMGHRKNFTKVG
ncbi:hypothetical protein SIN8267_01849 [Sinobacterium norvegicum]|uniref:Uncharacterized protein n=1 Tax=Sinobacterium norvegicum TaxID=1641715 RepID=A0ABN8EJ20_9GAMM|nr:hypothetical protein SIN8267_01849 [Sinobacterium norvegicum]